MKGVVHGGGAVIVLNRVVRIINRLMLAIITCQLWTQHLLPLVNAAKALKTTGVIYLKST